EGAEPPAGSVVAGSAAAGPKRAARAASAAAAGTQRAPQPGRGARAPPCRGCCGLGPEPRPGAGCSRPWGCARSFHGAIPQHRQRHPRPRRFTAENATEQQCRYFSKVQKFICRLKVPPGVDDNKPLVVSTCVRNSAGSAAGEDKIITLSGVLKPDPPLNVTVRALERWPQRLRVAWAYPSSWDPRFYWLRFQVRYRPEPARTFTEVDQVTQTSLDIADAWRGTRHVVQVRAQEEFGHGAWSEWSREAVGTPWTDPRDLASEPGPFSSQFPAEDGTDGYGATLPPELFGAEPAEEAADGGLAEAGGRSGAAPYAFLMAGGSLLLGIALFVGIVVR
uniref:Fibronectin type-III domain-containing protein n=1 Tax=Apteryx owenii TaxID=8824 RepID=A0A8B9PC01_APTOW